MIDGLKRLIAKRRLAEPTECREAIERIRIETDPLAGWIDEKGYVPGDNENVALKGAYDKFVEYCQENGHQRQSKKTFVARLRNARFTVKMPNGHAGMYCSFPS
jgi:phage/plasmid-associated DNA primase